MPVRAVGSSLTDGRAQPGLSKKTTKRPEEQSACHETENRINRTCLKSVAVGIIPANLFLFAVLVRPIAQDERRLENGDCRLITLNPIVVHSEGNYNPSIGRRAPRNASGCIYQPVSLQISCLRAIFLYFPALTPHNMSSRRSSSVKSTLIMQKHLTRCKVNDIFPIKGNSFLKSATSYQFRIVMSSVPTGASCTARWSMHGGS